MGKISTVLIDEIRQLLQALTAVELDVLALSIGGFSTDISNKKRRAKSEPKLLTALQLLQSDLSAEEVISQLETSIGADTYHRQFVVMHRLQHLTGKSLIADRALHQKDMYDQIFLSRVEIAEKKMYAEVLRKRGQTSQVLKIYKSITGLARKYEQYDDLVATLRARQEIAALRKEHKAYHKLEQELEAATSLRETLGVARAYYYKSALLSDHQGADRDQKEKDLKNFLRQAHRDLESRQKTHTSPAIRYYHNYIKAHILQRNGNYSKAEEPLKEMLALAIKAPYLKRQTIIGNVYLMLAENQLHKHCFNEAVIFAKRAATFYADTSANHQYTTEIAFFGLLYSGKTAAATALLEAALKRPVETGAFVEAKRQYLLACCHFLGGNFSKTADLLQASAVLRKDKGGWNPSHRTLEIMNSIERGLFDHADGLINAFAKYANQAPEDLLRKRDHLIVRALTALKKEAYRADPNHEVLTKLVRKLGGKAPDCVYKVQSAEVVVFHRWLQSKMQTIAVDLSASESIQATINVGLPQMPEHATVLHFTG